MFQLNPNKIENEEDYFSPRQKEKKCIFSPTKDNK
jgi:hypothetical protein